MSEIIVQIIKTHDNAVIPHYATAHSAGVDLYSVLESSIIIKPGERMLIPTGIAIALPDNYEAQIRPRSGLALKNGITVLNTPGTIDADYRGEIKVILINLGQEDFVVENATRIAQMIIAPVSHVNFSLVTKLADTDRGAGGFGSTGTRK